jgi:hypothetical protein
MVTGVRRVSAQVVWVAKDDGSDIIRADTIAGVGRDYNGNITARPARGEGSAAPSQSRVLSGSAAPRTAARCCR